MSSLAALARVPGRILNVPQRLARRAFRSARLRPALCAALGLPFDPFDPAFRANPYPAYHRLRASRPVYRMPPPLGVWLVTRHDDVASVLGDPRFVHPEYRARPLPRGADHALARFRRNSFISLNPPDHTRLRRAAMQVFPPQLMAQARSRAEAITDRLLDRVAAARRMDVVPDLAMRLPVTLAGELLGIPPEDAARCYGWTRDATASVEIAPTPAELARANESTRRTLEFFRAAVEARRARPGSDVLSALVQLQTREGVLDGDELVGTSMLLFVAAAETTVSLVGTAVLSLLRHPEAWAALRREPEGSRAAVEELLRFESPVQMVGRQAGEDVVLRGQRIRRGQTVFVIFGAANRDPERFPDPDRLDFSRPPGRTLTFGHGIHACIGQALARVEGQVVLERLVERCPSLRPGQGPAVWRDSLAFRALDSLPVEW